MECYIQKAKTKCQANFSCFSFRILSILSSIPFKVSDNVKSEQEIFLQNKEKRLIISCFEIGSPAKVSTKLMAGDFSGFLKKPEL